MLITALQELLSSHTDLHVCVMTPITRHGVPLLYKCVYCFKCIVGFIYQIQVSFQLNCSERSVANIQKLTGKLSHGVSAGDGEEQVDRLHTEEYKMQVT